MLTVVGSGKSHLHRKQESGVQAWKPGAELPDLSNYPVTQSTMRRNGSRVHAMGLAEKCPRIHLHPCLPWLEVIAVAAQPSAHPCPYHHEEGPRSGEDNGRTRSIACSAAAAHQSGTIQRLSVSWIGI
jgi:hypothetical protein